MSNQNGKPWLRSLGFALALGALGMGIHAQRGLRNRDAPVVPDGTYTCTCQGGGADCLFGEAEGCSVSCTEAFCDCRGASCVLGFPKSARCRCKEGPQA